MAPTAGSQQRRVTAWDPQSPATLMIPTSTSDKDSNNANDYAIPRMDTFLSHDGVGCNAHETSALMELLTARDKYLESDTLGGGNGLHANAGNVNALARAYRKALADCVHGWETELELKETATSENAMEEDIDDDDDDEEGPANNKEKENLDLLKAAYAVTQLSEAFLLKSSNQYDSIMVDDCYYHENNTSSLPGAVTAETVRHLRIHHMEPASAILTNEVLVDIENSMQPDQLDGGEPYWHLVLSYLLRGCLNDVWYLLSKHSLRTRATEALTLQGLGLGLDDYQAATLAQDENGFRALEALLLSAPIPGGRTDEFDADFDLGQHDDMSGDDELLEGVPPSAYRLWESNTSNRNSGDFPVTFQPNAAMQVYRLWQEAVKSLPEVQSLKRRIPQLSQVINILTGDFTGIYFGSWEEELCAELIYKLPNIRLEDIHVRASRHMKKHEESSEGPGYLDKVILSVMKGNTGSVVHVMHEMGGGSGAALPAVMTYLLCDLLEEVRTTPELSTEFSMRTELLLSAAFAIRSSFAIQGRSDIGTRLVVRLLLPYIKIDSDVRITANMVDTLEHHFPQTDAEANSLLDLCRKLVERKNIRVLDGCVSIALARYRCFVNDSRPGGAVHWLLVGMDLESLALNGAKRQRTGPWQNDLSTSVCYRLLVTYCMETSQSLLKGMLGDGEGASLFYAWGKEMVTACEDSEFAAFVPAIKILKHIVIMAESTAERKDDAIIATSIIACLEERTNEEDDGLVSCLARSPMQWDLVRLAKIIIDRNTERENWEEMHLYTASFDVRGMQVLLEKLTTITASMDMEGQRTFSSEEIQQIRLAFAEGLMRAFVAENAVKKLAYVKTSPVSVAGVYAADLGKVSREKQELVVENMLSF